MQKSYKLSEVSDYWSRRLRETDPLSAVLTFDAPPEINHLYDQWEIGCLRRALLPRGGSRPVLAGKTAVDVGCGIGRITSQLAGWGATVTGLDISPAMLAACRDRCRDVEVTLVEASVGALPLDSHSADIVTCFGVLEHLPERIREDCVREILRVMKKRGRAYVVVNNDRCLFLGDGAQHQKTIRHGYHVELVGLDWLTKSVSEAGGRVTPVAANPGYALLHYHGVRAGYGSMLKNDDFAALINEVGSLDSGISPISEISSVMASHFMVEVRRASR